MESPEFLKKRKKKLDHFGGRHSNQEVSNQSIPFLLNSVVSISWVLRYDREWFNERKANFKTDKKKGRFG